MRLDQSEDEVVISKHIKLASGEGAMEIREDIETGKNVVRLWNKATTNTPVLDLGTATTGNQVRLTDGVVAINSAELRVNTINSNGVNDVVFQRNGTTFFTLQLDSGINLMNFASNGGVSANKMYGNYFSNRSFSIDTIFEGSNTAGNARVEYMRYDFSAEALDFSTVIDNTGRSVIGNIVDTTVSDERLKSNIEEYHGDCSECIKTVKVKTFEYNDKKYDNNDKIGFIAQELSSALPEEFKDIVKDTKLKGEDETFKTINYMKLSVVLWKGLQEEIQLRENIESRVFELENIVKELQKPKTRTRKTATTEN